MSTLLDRVPCTIVTGFLGAGKTTLLRGLLEKLDGKRLAIIVNEFGDIGIDGEILKGCGIESCPEENIVELANGCICCTVADDFQPAIEQILSRQPKVEHILIETSGLALPKPLVQAFQWPAIKSRVTVDAVVAVVDGAALAEGQVAHDMEALAAQRANDEALDHDDPVEEVFEDQVACADLIVLTKADLLDDAGLNKARAHVLEHLPKAAKIVVASNGAIDPAVLIGLGLAVEEDIENRRTHHDGELDQPVAALRDRPLQQLQPHRVEPGFLRALVRQEHHVGAPHRLDRLQRQEIGMPGADADDQDGAHPLSLSDRRAGG